MNSDIKLSVKEVLNQEHFKQARILAGKNGVHRTVKWVHVIEIEEVSNLLNGNELILSTGVGWKQGNKTLRSLLEQLIDCKAAGLCIELGKYLDDIPEEIIELANRCDFPIIVFNQEVRFVDITESIHTLIIQKQYQMVTELEKYSRQLNEVLLETDPREKILRMLHEQVGMPVMYLPSEGPAEIISHKTKEEKLKALQVVRGNHLDESLSIARQKINVWNQTFAELMIISEEGSITEFETLFLDRTVTALAQVILRGLWIEEKRKAKEADWVQEWLNGEHSEEQIIMYLQELEPQFTPKRAVAILLKANLLDTESTNSTYIKILLRSIFREQGFLLLSGDLKSSIVFILIDKRNGNDGKKRMTAGIDQALKSDVLNKYPFEQVQISAGKEVRQLTQIAKSYQQAKEASFIKERMPNKITSYFYEDLHIFRLMQAVNDQGILREFVSDYLQPVLTYDETYNGNLLYTLKLYLQFNGSKKETAEKLYIVRQTLYHRLEKLQELLGEDFMKAPKRQAIEFSLSAYAYLTESE